MATELLAGHVLVNSGLVRNEVLIDSEGGLNRSVGVDLLHDRGLVTSNRVRGGREVLVTVPISTVLAGVHTGWGGNFITTWGQGARDVVLAGSDLVRIATLTRVVVSTSHNTGALEVVPGSRGVTTIASHTTAERATGEQVLSGENGLVSSVGMNADTIGGGLGSTEGPARATSSLVTNMRNAWALGAPLITRIKAVWELEVARSHATDWEFGSTGENTTEALDVANGLLVETGVESSGPSSSNAVDEVDHVDVLGGSLIAEVLGGLGGANVHAELDASHLAGDGGGGGGGDLDVIFPRGNKGWQIDGLGEIIGTSNKRARVALVECANVSVLVEDGDAEEVDRDAVVSSADVLAQLSINNDCKILSLDRRKGIGSNAADCQVITACSTVCVGDRGRSCEGGNGQHQTYQNDPHCCG